MTWESAYIKCWVNNLLTQFNINWWLNVIWRRTEECAESSLMFSPAPGRSLVQCSLQWEAGWPVRPVTRTTRPEPGCSWSVFSPLQSWPTNLSSGKVSSPLRDVIVIKPYFLPQEFQQTSSSPDCVDCKPAVKYICCPGLKKALSSSEARWVANMTEVKEVAGGQV